MRGNEKTSREDLDEEEELQADVTVPHIKIAPWIPQAQTVSNDIQETAAEAPNFNFSPMSLPHHALIQETPHGHTGWDPTKYLGQSGQSLTLISSGSGDSRSVDMLYAPDFVPLRMWETKELFSSIWITNWSALGTYEDKSISKEVTLT